MNKNNIKFYTKIAKVDSDLRMVYGYCTTESMDSQGEVVSKQAIRKAWQAYMEYGNVREMHQPSAVGITKEYSHDDTGTWIGVKVVDEDAWIKVKEGVYKGFSIGGRVTLKVDNVIKGIILSEISLVDRPACPDAKITVIKVDDGLVNTLSLQEINNYNMKKFIEIDGVKYVEDPENVGQPLVDATTGEKVLFVEEAIEEDKKVEDETVVDPVEPPAVENEPAKAEPAPEPAPENIENPEQKMFKSSGFVEKAIKAGVLAKDSDGILMGASLLDHLEYVISCCAGDGKDVSSLIAVKNALMQFIKDEANEMDGEKSAKNGDLNKMAKMFSEEVLGKVSSMIKSELGGLIEKVDGLTKEVEIFKNTKVSKRPASGSFVTEKAFESGDNTAKSVDDAKKEVEDVRSRIEAHSVEMRNALAENPSRAQEYTAKSTQLITELRAKEAVLQNAIQGR